MDHSCIGKYLFYSVVFFVVFFLNKSCALARYNKTLPPAMFENVKDPSRIVAFAKHN